MNNGIKNFDVVNKPRHYADRDIEMIDYIADNMTDEMYRGYLESNVIKYISRYKHKNGAEDLKKCKWYLEKLINDLCEVDNGNSIY